MFYYILTRDNCVCVCVCVCVCHLSCTRHRRIYTQNYAFNALLIFPSFCFINTFLIFLHSISWYQSLGLIDSFLPWLLLLQKAQTQIIFQKQCLKQFQIPHTFFSYILLTIPTTFLLMSNGKNYGTWKKSMEIALIAKNKLGFVLRTCGQPGSISPLFSQWDRCDKMVISWLLHVVEKSISDSILFSNSSRQI